MRYVEYINGLIGEKTSKTEGLVLFGQNIAAGSCLSGLTRNLKVGARGRIINTPNSENTLVGSGFGMMLDGVSSIFFMKQQDFLLLGIDQLVDTYNFIRRKNPTASFTIVFIVVDVGYHGLQSSLNNFGDFCSMARIPGFTITNRADAEAILNTHLISPGFRIIGVSQRLFGQEISDAPVIYANEEKTLFQYREGAGATIVCFNLSFPYGATLANRLKENSVDASLFSVNAATPIKWGKIIESAGKTKNLVVIDDSKSANHSSDSLLVETTGRCRLDNEIIVRRAIRGDEWLYPNSDELKIDYDDIVNKINHPRS